MATVTAGTPRLPRRRVRAGPMSSIPMPWRWVAVGGAVAALAGVIAAATAQAIAVADARAGGPAIVVAHHPRQAAPAAPSAPVFGDTLLGRSGQLRVHLVPVRELPAIVGDERAAAPGVYPVSGGIGGHPFSFVALRAFSLKVGATVGDYYVGYWPAERHRIRSEAYANPTGFVEVTPANQDTWVSAHFRLRDFVTHDQLDVWPKYVVLREALLDKLELVLQDLALRGIATTHVVVLSGFRTPAYNLALGDASGRSRESRHQYGDAADIIIDADGDGRMDDLNWDGRVNAGDVRVVEQAVTRVERRYPELEGGLGVYAAMGPHGPFAHIDVRGEVARWTGGRRRGGRASGDPSRATRIGHCYATGASAVLCLPRARRAR
ncbi:MAG TPA: hypothetical protein VF041_09310 [Gemmatimonadaceae bacterium]